MRTRLELPLLDAPLMVVSRLVQDVGKFPPPVAAPWSLSEPTVEPQGAQPGSKDELVLLQQGRSERVSPQVPQSQEPPCRQVNPQPWVPLVLEHPARPVSLSRAPPSQLESPALQGLQVLVVQPQALPASQVPAPDASALLSPPRLSLPCPPWPLLLPLLPRPLLPGDVCALSPQHPREWSSSASSSP